MATPPINDSIYHMKWLKPTSKFENDLFFIQTPVRVVGKVRAKEKDETSDAVVVKVNVQKKLKVSMKVSNNKCVLFYFRILSIAVQFYKLYLLGNS